MKTSRFAILAVLCGFLGLGLMAGRALAEPTSDPLAELEALKAAYQALKANADPSLKPLLWAGLIAVVLRTLLTLANAIWTKPKKWLAWTALIAAVPIALLSHYAGGHGWMAAIVVAGGGPGAILFNEVLKLFAKKTEVAA
jgi:hypothetical protein